MFLYQDWVLLTQPLFISWSDFEWLQKYHTSLEYTSKRRMLAYNHLKSVSDYFFWHFLTIFNKNTHNQFLTIFIKKIIYITRFLFTKYSWTTAKLKSKWWTKTKTLHWHVISFNLEKLTRTNTEINNGKIWHLFFFQNILEVFLKTTVL